MKFPSLASLGHRSPLAPPLVPFPRTLLALCALGILYILTIAGPRVQPTVPNLPTPLPNAQATSSLASIQEILANPDIIASHHHPLVGLPAPQFQLHDIDGKTRTLLELQDNRPVVLIFYYGYRCRSCVRQLFEINNDLSLFDELGARVIAISADPVELTQKGDQQNGSFAFPVLSDPGDKTALAYQIFKRTTDGNLAETRRHATFVVDGKGIVRWANVGDAPFRRNSALLYQLKQTQGSSLR